MSGLRKTRTIILTGGVAASAVTGAWYGAGLKTKQDIKKEVKARAEATPAEKITYLEQTRSGLVVKKVELERKIEQLEARMAGRGDASASNNGGKGRGFRGI